VRATDPRDDPTRNVLLDAQQEEIRRAHAQLPVRQREVLALRELGGLSYDEIAATMDLNRNSVAQLLSRARLNLRAHLRAGALGSVAAAGPDCERALPLLAAQQDGQLDDAGDGRWLRAHLTACDTCGVAREAMAEAGASYRLWVPVAAAPWLFKATMARAAEAIGADWSDVIERGRPPEPAPGVDRGSRRRRRRRDAILAAAFGTLLLLTAFAAATGERARLAGSADPVATAVAAPVEGANPAAARRARRPAAPRPRIRGRADATPTTAPDPTPTSAAPRRATSPPGGTATPPRRSAPRRTRPDRARETPKTRATPVPPSAATPPAPADDPPPPEATPEATATPTAERVVDPPPPPPPPRECRNAAGQPIRCPPGPL
jgi:DNA-binding CsgD family transcriptional regulator